MDSTALASKPLLRRVRRSFSNSKMMLAIGLARLVDHSGAHVFKKVFFFQVLPILGKHDGDLSVRRNLNLWLAQVRVVLVVNPVLICWIRRISLNLLRNLVYALDLALKLSKLHLEF